MELDPKTLGVVRHGVVTVGVTGWADDGMAFTADPAGVVTIYV